MKTKFYHITIFICLIRYSIGLLVVPASLAADLELVVGGVRRLRGVDPEDVGQAAGHQQPHVFVGVPEEELGGQVERQGQVLLLLLLGVLIHVHVGLHHHL